MADNHVVFADGARGRHSTLSGRHHQHRPRRRVLVMHGVMVDARRAVAAHQPSATAERVDESLPELGAHEAVGDRIAAGRDERQQVDVVHRRRRDVRHGVEVVKDAPRLHDVHRRPADEEQYDDDGQHLDAASLGANAAVARRSRVAGVDESFAGRRAAVRRRRLGRVSSA